MSYISERVAYLKGLAEGMNISDSTNEGKLLKSIIDVLEDMALEVEDIVEIQDELSEQVDAIDEDLSLVETEVFGDGEEKGCGCGHHHHHDDEDEDSSVISFNCPHCGEEIEVDIDEIEDADVIECPNCEKEIEIEWDCDCGDHGHGGDEDEDEE